MNFFVYESFVNCGVGVVIGAVVGVVVSIAVAVLVAIVVAGLWGSHLVFDEEMTHVEISVGHWAIVDFCSAYQVYMRHMNFALWGLC